MVVIAATTIGAPVEIKSSGVNTTAGRDLMLTPLGSAICTQIMLPNCMATHMPYHNISNYIGIKQLNHVIGR